jgi:hypothetical protein
MQENVGRQGADSFPGGIAILTAAGETLFNHQLGIVLTALFSDYFTLGNRANAYLNVAPAVARHAPE